jgi:hypothetical protein
MSPRLKSHQERRLKKSCCMNFLKLHNNLGTEGAGRLLLIQAMWLVVICNVWRSSESIGTHKKSLIPSEPNRDYK